MVSADYRFLAGVTSHQGALEHPRRYVAKSGALNKPRLKLRRGGEGYF
jgi:hypothetical protein